MSEYALPALILPENCQPRDAAIKVQFPDAYISQQFYTCGQGISGQPLRLEFPVFNPAVSSLIRIELLHGGIHNHILKPGESSWIVPERESTLSVAREYLVLGVRHIFAGVDHLLFIACLVIVARTSRRILLTITGFTIAHTLTLVLSTLHLVELPVPPVEALIALSIAFLAHEIAAGREDTWTWRYPVTVSSGFGLLHGFGFAALLRAIGLPRVELPAAMLFFNLGVEIGQIVFVSALALVLYFSSRLRLPHILLYHRIYISRITAYLIGIIASFWFVQRVAGF